MNIVSQQFKNCIVQNNRFNDFIICSFTGNLLGMEPPSETSKTHILDMNEHCLLHIFEKLYVADLCALHGTCTRFRMLSVLAYKLEYGDTYINPFGRTDGELTTQIFQQEVIRTQNLAIKTFGGNLRKLSVTNFGKEDNMRFKQFVLLFTQHLHSLEELELYDFTIRDVDNEITDLAINWDVYQLKRLILKNGYVHPPAFIPFLQKIGFKLKYFDECQNVPERKKNYAVPNQCLHYIKLVPNITELRTIMTFNNSSLFRTIFDLLPQLDSLSVFLVDMNEEYRVFPRMIKYGIEYLQLYVSNVIKLKKFQFGVTQCSRARNYAPFNNWNSILPHFANLEHLHLTDSVFGNIKNFSPIKNLKTLYLEHEHLTTIVCKTIAITLIHLKFLGLIRCYYEFVDKFDELYEFGIHAHNLETIFIAREYIPQPDVLNSFPDRSKPLRIIYKYTRSFGRRRRCTPHLIHVSRNVTFELTEDLEYIYENNMTLRSLFQYKKIYWHEKKNRLQVHLNESTKYPMILADKSETYLTDSPSNFSHPSHYCF